MGNKIIRHNQSRSDNDGIDPESPEIIGPKGREKIAEEDQGFPDIASRPAQEHFDHSAIGRRHLGPDYGCGLKKGMIGLWLGAVASVPVGWNICDGSNGTPDLRNYFIKVINLAGEIGDTGN